MIKILNGLVEFIKGVTFLMLINIGVYIVLFFICVLYTFITETILGASIFNVLMVCGILIFIIKRLIDWIIEQNLH